MVNEQTVDLVTFFTQAVSQDDFLGLNVDADHEVLDFLRTLAIDDAAVRERVPCAFVVEEFFLNAVELLFPVGVLLQEFVDALLAARVGIDANVNGTLEQFFEFHEGDGEDVRTAYGAAFLRSSGRLLSPRSTRIPRCAKLQIYDIIFYMSGRPQARGGAEDSRSAEDATRDTLAALLKQPDALTTEQADSIRAVLKHGSGDVRRALQNVLDASIEDLLTTSVANYHAWCTHGTELVCADDIDAACRDAHVDALPDADRERLLQWQVCYAAIDGTVGSDARMALVGNEQYVTQFLSMSGTGYTDQRRFTSVPQAACLPGMISPALLHCQAQMQALLSAIRARNVPEIQSLLQSLLAEPPPQELLRLAASPETLYQRLLLEGQIAIRQTTEHYRWRTAAGGQSAISDIVGHIQRDPAAFLRQILEYNSLLQANAKPITWNAATPFVRSCQTIGVPAFDVPLQILSRLPADTREQLRAEADRLAHAGDMTSENRTYLQHVTSGIAAFTAQISSEHEWQQPFDDAFVMQLTSAVSQHVGGKAETKFIRLAPQVFEARKGHTLGCALVRTLGFIPRSFYEAKWFRENADFQDIASLHGELLKLQREAEHYDYADFDIRQYLDRVLHARSLLLTHLFIGGAAGRLLTTPKSRTNAVSIDPRGITITMNAPRSADQQGLIHGHIPFSIAAEELLELLVREQWIMQSDADLVRVQRALRQNNVHGAADAHQRLLDAFMDPAERTEEGYRSLLDAFSTPQGRVQLTKTIRKSGVCPPSLTDALLAEGESVGHLTNVVAALQVMQQVQSGIQEFSEGKPELGVGTKLHAAVFLSILLPVLRNVQAADALVAGGATLRRMSGNQESGERVMELRVSDGRETAVVLFRWSHLPHFEALQLQPLLGN